MDVLRIHPFRQDDVDPVSVIPIALDSDGMVGNATKLGSHASGHKRHGRQPCLLRDGLKCRSCSENDCNLHRLLLI